jgi:uncharacterized protein YoxC
LLYSTINTVNNNNINQINSLSGFIYNQIGINNNINNSLSGFIYNQIGINNSVNQNISSVNQNISSISGFIKNQLSINTYVFNTEISLSGLIYGSQNQIYINNFNQNIINQNYLNFLNSLQNQVNSNNKSASQASTGNTIGNIFNGIATIGIAAGSAFLFTTVFTTLASLQAQATTEAAFSDYLDNKMSLLTERVKELETKVRRLQEEIEEPSKGLLFRCEFLQRNSFRGDFFIEGTLQQTNLNPLKYNQISSNTIFYSNVQVKGILYDNSQHVTDIFQF